jgi:hypothetical protein
VINSIWRLLVFSILGPVLGVVSGLVGNLILGIPVEIDEGTFIAFAFTLGGSIVTGPTDGYLAHFFSQPLRAFLTALFGAVAAAFLVFGLTRGAVTPQSLMNVALAGAACMGLCSLISAIP